jgi:hypothetical protein
MITFSVHLVPLGLMAHVESATPCETLRLVHRLLVASPLALLPSPIRDRSPDLESPL